MKRKKSDSFFSNVRFNLIYHISLYIAPLITAPYISRVLGSALIGRHSFAQSIVAYFIMAATMGTTLYGQRAIASQKENELEQTKVFWEIVWTRTVLTAISGAVYLLLVLPNCDDPILYVIVGLEIAQVALDISWFFQGKECFSVIAGCVGIGKLAAVALILLFVKTEKDFNLYALISSASILAGFLSQWFFLRQFLDSALFRPCPLRTLCRHLIGAIKLFAAQAIMQVYTVLDKTMIGMITGAESENGYYEQAQKLIRVLVAVSTVVSSVVASRMAILFKEGKKREMQTLLDFSMRFVCCVSIPIAVGLNLSADWLVPIYLGPDFEGAIPLIRVLGVLPLVIGASTVIGIQYFVPTGQEHLLTRSVFLGAAVNVVLNSIFIYKFAALGAAIASLIAELSVTAAQFYMVRKQIHWKQYPRMVLRYVLLCVPMALLGGFLKNCLHYGVVSLALLVVSCCMLYLAELIVLKDPFLSFFKKRQKEE